MAATNRAIEFHFADISFYFPARNKTRGHITELLQAEGKDLLHVSYIFCSDTYLLQLNKDYLQHNTLTDIITFHYQKGDEPVHADIYISIERVRENAGKFNVTFRQEFCRVLFHGALHLCGYKDKKMGDRKVMREKEEFYLRLFGVSRGT